jgi:hypothetical protein
VYVYSELFNKPVHLIPSLLESPVTPDFIAQNSTFLENVLEHRFIFDVSKSLLFKQKDIVNIMRSEVDAFGFDFVLSAGGRTVYIQMKTRSNIPPSNGYAIADALWTLNNAYVVWMLYNSEDLELISYYCLDCSKSLLKTFLGSKRKGRRNVKMQKATYQNLSLEQLLEILFPTPI